MCGGDVGLLGTGAAKGVFQILATKLATQIIESRAFYTQNVANIHVI
jgi:hypothetical protein